MPVPKPDTRARERRAFALIAALWWVGAIGVAFFIAAGGLTTVSPVVYVSLIVIMTAHYDGQSVFAAIPAMWDLGWFMVAAQAAFGFFTLVVATSLLIVRRRWRYETWHTVHLLVYAAIALVVAHQFIQGSTFISKGAAWWFWLALYVVALGSWLTFRVVKPLV